MLNFIIYLSLLVLSYSILLAGQRLLLFDAGLLFLGGAALHSAGAYFSAFFSMSMGWPVPLAVIAAAVVTFVFSLVVGYPLLRMLKQDYFALVTLVLTQTFFVFLRSFAPGGTSGIAGIPPLSTPLCSFLPQAADSLLFVLIFSCAVLILLRIILKRLFGVLLSATRVDENVLSTFGYSPLAIKTQVFGLAGMLAGLSGALQAHLIGAIDPSLSSIQETVLIICGTILSGRRFIWGSLMGATFIIAVPEILQRLLSSSLNVGWQLYPSIQALYGVLVIIIAFMVFPRKQDFLKSDVMVEK